LPTAETSFRSAYNLSPGNVSAARELAAVCLARGNLEDAESFAREAHSYATSNPYLLDILISILIRRYGGNVKYRSEIVEMFDALEMVGDEGGKSFFTTRKAEYEHLWGDNKKALNLIAAAVRKTPNIFEVRRLETQMLLKDGNRVKAGKIVALMKNIVNARNPSERRSNYRSYLETQADYLVEVGKFKEAKDIFEDQSVFTGDERNAAVREIEITQGYLKK
jgi:hypothetical protein